MMRLSILLPQLLRGHVALEIIRVKLLCLYERSRFNSTPTNSCPRVGRTFVQIKNSNFLSWNRVEWNEPSSPPLRNQERNFILFCETSGGSTKTRNASTIP
jgi:hypothetical protein